MTPNIWIVEDHHRLRETLVEILRDSELGEVSSFANCETALADTIPTTPDAIVLDIDLPGMSGIEVICHFKERFPSCEIVMFTAFDDREKIFAAICAGASGYLLKSESPARIAAAVKKVLEGGSPMTPEIARLVVARFSQLQPSGSEVRLSEREEEFLRCLVDGLAKKEIAERLDLSVHTIDNYVRRIYKKLHVNTLGGLWRKRCGRDWFKKALH